MEVGGLQFPAAPFNGWYNSVEIVRDFLEEPRYDLLEVRQRDLKVNPSFPIMIKIKLFSPLQKY